MIFNAAFDGMRLEYNLTYDNTLSYSPAFRAYAESLANRLVSSYGLEGKDIVDVGCGNGDFLDKLCELGHNRGRGFDPSAASRSKAGLPDIVSEFFVSPDKVGSVDFVCCRYVLEHIEAPQDLLQSVRQCLSDREGVAYFEVPNVNSVLDGPTTWDVIYPHCSYFSIPSLRHLFQSSGFEVTRIETTFGGQFLAIDARVSYGRTPKRPETKGVAAVARLADRFESKLRENILRWSRFIEYASVEGCRIAMWGAGTKGVTFLNVIPGAERVLAVVDLNPRKHGAFIPGTAQPVISPDRLAEYSPDVVIVLNPLYRAEIEGYLSRLGIDPLVVVDPHLPLPARARSLKAVAG